MKLTKEQIEDLKNINQIDIEILKLIEKVFILRQKIEQDIGINNFNIDKIEKPNYIG